VHAIRAEENRAALRAMAMALRRIRPGCDEGAPLRWGRGRTFSNRDLEASSRGEEKRFRRCCHHRLAQAVINTNGWTLPQCLETNATTRHPRDPEIAPTSRNPRAGKPPSKGAVRRAEPRPKSGSRCRKTKGPSGERPKVHASIDGHVFVFRVPRVSRVACLPARIAVTPWTSRPPARQRAAVAVQVIEVRTLA